MGIGIFFISTLWRYHIELVASSSSFFTGPYVAMIRVFLFLPQISIAVHLPQSLGSWQLSVTLAYLPMIGCTAIVIPPMCLFFAIECDHDTLCCLFEPVHSISISFSILILPFSIILWSINAIIIVLLYASLFHISILSIISPHPAIFSAMSFPFN